MFGLVSFDFFLFYPGGPTGEMAILDIIIGRPGHTLANNIVFKNNL